MPWDNGSIGFSDEEFTQIGKIGEKYDFSHNVDATIFLFSLGFRALDGRLNLPDVRIGKKRTRYNVGTLDSHDSVLLRVVEVIKQDMPDSSTNEIFECLAISGAAWLSRQIDEHGHFGIADILTSPTFES